MFRTRVAISKIHIIGANFTKRAIHTSSKKLHRSITIQGNKQTIFSSNDYNLPKCKYILENERIAVLGYGSQGRPRALNLKNNGLMLV